MIVGAAATIVLGAGPSWPRSASRSPTWPRPGCSWRRRSASRIAPANTGSLAIGVRFLQRSGLQPGPAAAAVGLCAGRVRGPPAAHRRALAWVGTSEVGFSPPQADALFIAIAVALSASGLVVGLVPGVRRRVLPPLISQGAPPSRRWRTC